jgi:acyl carrier protein
VIDQMVPLFCEVLDADDIELTEETSAADIVEWDSLNHVQLLHRIEEHFRLRLPPEEVSAFENIGDMARAIVARLGAS